MPCASRLLPMIGLAGLAAAFCAGSAAAETVVLEETVAVSAGDAESCAEAGRTAAARQALRRLVADETVYRRLAGQADRFVLRSRTRDVAADGAAGGCRVTVQLDMDRSGVMAAARASSGLADRSAVPLGVVLRFLIDGELAVEHGYNDQQAVARLEMELDRLGFDLVSLVAMNDAFASRNFTIECPIGPRDADLADCNTFESYAETIVSTLDILREALSYADELAPLRACGGLVATVELKVKQLGPNPYDVGFLVQHAVHGRVSRLSDYQAVVSVAPQSREADDRTAAGAIDQAMFVGLQDFAIQLARALDGQPAVRQCQAAGR